MKVVHALWWLVFLVASVILVGSLPGYWVQVNQVQPDTGLSEAQSAALWLGALLSAGAGLLCGALAALLYFKKPNDRMALFLSFYLLIFGSFMAGPLEHFLPYWIPASASLALQLQSLIWGLPTIILVLIFPNGQFIPRWTRWLVVAGCIVSVLFLLAIRDPEELVRINSLASQSGTAALAILFLISIGVQFNRYFRLYTPLERQQTKWVLYGFFVSYLLLAIVSIPYLYFLSVPPGTPLPWWLSFTALGWWGGLMLQPIVFTVAILRARLWDIDVIVRRTVLYALVTLTLALIYFASVILLQRIFAELTGVEDVELVNVLSTLAIAALFVPVRDRLQNEIDKRFNRKKYDAQKVLREFAETARDETNLDSLTAHLLEIVQETMEPKSISLWLRRERGEVPDKR